jgi:hypothetical protein
LGEDFFLAVANDLFQGFPSMRMLCASRWFAALGVVVLALSGCGGVGTLYPVSGKVTVDDGQPLADAQLSFVADTEKGNKTTAIPFAKVKDGSYSLTTKGRTGAPAGWYKVSVMTHYPGGPAKAVELPRRYTDAGKSRLSVEVVPSPQPGAYDLKLSSR